MPALVGCVLSYALLVSGVSGADPSAPAEICAPDAPEVGACTFAIERSGPRRVGTPGAAADVVAMVAMDYATPVEVNCPTIQYGNAVVVFGGCDLPSFDFRYRVSRFPDSERPAGALGPQRDRRASHATAIFTGAPPARGGVPSAATAAPLAIYALARLPSPREGRIQFEHQVGATTRVLEPLERPPRA